MTAGQVGYGLGSEKKEITVNYRATDELLHYQYERNPMPDLEFTKHQFNFQQMKAANENDKYTTDVFFPDGISFKEPLGPADYKPEIFSLYPETLENGKKRGISLIELMNKRI